MNKLDAYTRACFLIHKSTKWDESHYWNIVLAKQLGYCLLIRNIKTGNATYHNLFCKLNSQSSRNEANNFWKKQLENLIISLQQKFRLNRVNNIDQIIYVNNKLLRNTERILTVIDIIQVSASMLDSGGSHIATCYKGQAKTNRQIYFSR